MKKIFLPFLICLAILGWVGTASAEKPPSEDFPIAPGFDGHVGLFRTTSAYTPLMGTFSVGYHLRFTQLTDYPEIDMDTSVLEGDAHLGVALADFLEVALSAGHTANSIYDNIYKERSLTQTMGDIRLGVKGGYDGDIILHVGGDLYSIMKTNLDDLGINTAAFVLGLRTNFTFNFTELKDPIPLRLHFNFGYRKDHSEYLRKNSTDGSVNYAYDQALGIPADDDILTYAFGVEVPQKYITFFLEYTTEQAANIDNDKGVEARSFGQNPMFLTPGIRVTPIGGLIIDLGVDIGLSSNFNPDPDNPLSDEAKVAPDWKLILGVSYMFSPGSVRAPEGKVMGQTIDEETKEPVGAVMLEFPGQNLTALLSNTQSGRFLTYGFEPGPIEIIASKDGYETKKITVDIQRDQTIMRDIELTKLASVGLITGRVTDTKGKPLAGVISFVGTALENVASDPTSGVFSGRVPPEIYTVRASANGYIPETKKVQIVDRKRTTVNFVLKPERAAMGTIKGTVTTADNQPLAAIISVPENSQLAPMASNPTNGAYQGQLPPGQHRVQAFAQGYKPSIKLVEIAEDSETVVDFVLESAIDMGTLQGTVTNVENKPLFALIISDEEPPKFTQIVTDPDSGSFMQQLPAGIYKIKATSQGHRAEFKTVEIAKAQNTIVDFKLKPLRLATLGKKSIEIREQVHFTTGKATIMLESYPLLDEVASILQDNPSLSIRIEGHTDSVGSDKYNERLSQLRANSIRKFLIDRGVDQARLEAVGFGEAKPIADNNTPEGRAKNRRVEFNILGGSAEGMPPLP